MIYPCKHPVRHAVLVRLARLLYKVGNRMEWWSIRLEDEIERADAPEERRTR